jgi:hypothetical protein
MIGCSAAARSLKDEFPEGEEHERDAVMKRAMELAFHKDICWMCVNDDEKFKIGVGALLMYYKDDEEFQARVDNEMRLLQAFSAALSGVPVNFGALAGGDEEETPEALGLLGIFKETKARLECPESAT